MTLENRTVECRDGSELIRLLSKDAGGSIR